MYIFDLDGTLLDSNGIWYEVDRKFLARRGMSYTEEFRDGVEYTTQPIAAEFAKRYCKLSESCEEIMQEWRDLAKEGYQRAPLKPGAHAYLKKLQSEGKRMAVFTGCVPQFCNAALRRHGIDSFFERVLFAQDMGRDKNDPQTFRLVAQMLSVDPAECTVFEDSVRACRSASAAGMRTIGIFDSTFCDSREDMQRACDRMIVNFESLL